MVIANPEYTGGGKVGTHMRFIMLVGGCKRSVSRTTASRNGRPMRTSYGRLVWCQSATSVANVDLASRTSARSRACAWGSRARM